MEELEKQVKEIEETIRQLDLDHYTYEGYNI
jgi:hypothetical protein